MEKIRNIVHKSEIISYQSACLVVMQVDSCARIVPTFERVHKLFGDLLSKRHIITTASPNPSSTTCGLRNADYFYPILRINNQFKGGSFNLEECENEYIPVCPILESSQPQLSKSPILQFLVSVYITPAALMACTKDVSLVAGRNHNVTNSPTFWSTLAAYMFNGSTEILCVNRA